MNEDIARAICVDENRTLRNVFSSLSGTNYLNEHSLIGAGKGYVAPQPSPSQPAQ